MRCIYQPNVCMWECCARSIESSRVCILLLLWLSRRRQVGKFMGERGDSFLTNFFPSRTSKGTKGHDPGTRLEAWRELYHTHTHTAQRERERCEMSERSCSHNCAVCIIPQTPKPVSHLSRPPNLSCALALLHADHRAAARSRLTLACQ